MDALYRAALGPVQLPRYLALFKRFDQTGRAPAGWNTAASLATLNWMLLHHLWTAALIYVALVEGLALLIFGVGRPLLHWPEQVEWGLIAACAMFAIALPGLFGDALLHSEIRKRIARALVAAQTIPQTCELLARQASSWRRLTWIALANLVLFGAIALAWLLVPPSGWSGASTASTPMASGPVQTAARPPPAAAQPAAELSAAAPATAASEPSPSLSPSSMASLPPEPPSQSAATDGAAAPAPAPSASEPQASTPAIGPASAPTPARPAPAATAASTAAAGPAARKADKPSAKRAATKAESDAVPVAAAPASSAPSPPPPPSEPASAPVTGSSPAASAAADARPAVPVGSAPGYYLNVGFFAEEANARRTQAKLLNANLPAFRQTTATPNGDRFRVRVGPFANEAEANKAAAQIRSSLKLDTLMYRQGG